MKSKAEKVAFIVFTSIIFVYLFARAMLSGTLNDEAFTFLKYIHSEKFLPFTPNTPVSANNHYFNSILTWVCYKAFGISEWVIRLPNLLAFPVYMWYIYKLGKKLSKSYLRCLFWILLTGAHYYIEFFAYCRGYGLSMAFLAGSIYHLIRASINKTSPVKHMFIGFLLICLGAFSNLNLLLPMFIWFGLGVFNLWLSKKRRIALPLYVLLSALPIYFLSTVALSVNSHEQIPIGESGLLKSLDSLLNMFVAEGVTNLKLLYIPILVFIAIGGAYFLLREKAFKLSPLFTFYTFILLNVAGLVILNVAMNVNYPIGRMGFPLYFFLAACIPFIIDKISGFMRPALSLVIFLIFAPVLIFTVKSANLYSSVDQQWKRQQISDDFLFKTVRINQDQDFPLSMFAPENFYTVNMAFKTLKYDLQINACHVFPPYHPYYSADLLIVDTTRFPAHKNNYQEVYYDLHSTMSLMKRVPKMAGTVLADSIIHSSTYSDEKFTALGRFLLNDKSEGKTLRVNIDLEIYSEEKPLLSLLTLEVKDSSGSMTIYDQISLDYLATDYSNGIHHQLSFLIDKLPQGSRVINCYFWNYDQKLFLLKRSNTTLLTLQSPDKPAT